MEVGQNLHVETPLAASPSHRAGKAATVEAPTAVGAPAFRPVNRLRKHFWAFALVLLLALPLAAQRGRGGNRDDSSSQGEMELQTGIALTRKGQFQDAIPHFLSARGQVRDEFALEFNLALCYVGSAQPDKAIEILNNLRVSSHATAPVENLLAQALFGAGKPDDAVAAVERAARMTPKDEKIYLLPAEASLDAGAYDAGLKVLELGLRNLPNSARLLFERGFLLTQTDRLDDARPDFQRVAQLARGQDIAYIAAAEQAMFDGNVAEAMRVSREGIEKVSPHFMLLTIYGEAVLRAGIALDQPDFADAQAALEKAVNDRPTYASAQIALGKLYLQQNRVDAALARLEIGRKLDPRNPAVYSNLAVAYRRKGDAAQADAALATLSQINKEQSERIGAASGDRKSGYASRIPTTPPPQKPPQ